tara:strand:- start:646 stop:2010 length:1365 start_codon:yes stop_codon:yes gene_type:complete
MTRPVTKSFVIAALLSSSAAYAETPGWQVSEISGNVTVARKGAVKIAQRQTKLAAGDVIKTGPKGRAVLLRGGEYLVVSPASHIEIAEPAANGKVTQIIEYLGNVLFRIDKKATPHFGVKTPYMAAVVKGTTFSVSVSAEGSAVQVTEGAVEVSTLDDGASELITPGVIGMINAADPFDLVVVNGERRVIQSPNKPATVDSGNVTATLKQPAVSQVIGTVKLPASNLSGVVSAPIGEDAVELAALTNGLIRGDVNYNRFAAIENAEESIGTTEGVIDNIAGEDETTGDFDNGLNGDGQGEDTNSPGNNDDADNDDGNNGHGNDADGVDDSNPGNGNGNDDGDDAQIDMDVGGDDDADNDDGNNGHGNDADGDDDSNPGNGNNDDAQLDVGVTVDVGGDDALLDVGVTVNVGNDDDDGNNGHGNDADGIDDSNPGNGNGNGRGKGLGLGLGNNDD